MRSMARAGPPQPSVTDEGLEHVPFSQRSMSPQEMPQVPQLFGSWLRSTQTPSQKVVEFGHSHIP